MMVLTASDEPYNGISAMKANFVSPSYTIQSHIFLP